MSDLRHLQDKKKGMPSPLSLASQLERELAACTAPLLAEYERLYATSKALAERELRAGRTHPDYLLGCRYVQLMLATMRALHHADMPAAAQHRARWEAVACQRLDAQLFGASAPAAVAFKGGASRVCEGTDCVTKSLADLVMSDRALLEKLEQPCSALALVREVLAGRA